MVLKLSGANDPRSSRRSTSGVTQYDINIVNSVQSIGGYGNIDCQGPTDAGNALSLSHAAKHDRRCTLLSGARPNHFIFPIHHRRLNVRMKMSPFEITTDELVDSLPSKLVASSLYLGLAAKTKVFPFRMRT